MALDHAIPAAPFQGDGAAAPPRTTRFSADEAPVGVDFLIMQAGGEEAVLRATALRLHRVLRQANMLELTEAIHMTLLALAPEALEQLADARWGALDAASRRLALRATAPLQ